VPAKQPAKPDDEPSSGLDVAAWLREDAGRPDAVRCWHSALEVAACHVDDATALWSHYGGRTFWLSSTDSPRCGFERLALDILQFHTASLPAHALTGTHGGMDASSDEGLAAEWWVQVRRGSQGEGASIGMHFDCDEHLQQAEGVNIPPWLSTVTYLTGEGAPTVVLPIRADAGGSASFAPTLRAAFGGSNEADATGSTDHASASGGGTLGDGSGAFVSLPVPGKHLAFDGRLLHGCPAEMADSREHTRLTFLVNIWPRHRVLGVDRLPAHTAATLSDDDLKYRLHATPQAVHAAEQEVISDSVTGDSPVCRTPLPILSERDATQSLLRLSGRVRFSVRDGELTVRFQSN